MALTATVKTDLYRFFAIAFDAAPGVTYMTQLAEASAAGMTVEQIVEVFTTKQQFTATYPAFLTAGDFAAKLVNNVVGGSASDTAKAEAAADIEAALSAGWSRGKVIYQVFNNLASLTGDAKWGGTAAQMANQVAYAQYYTEVLLGDTTNLSTLRGVIAGVTPTTDVTAAAIDAVLNPPPVVVVPSYALSANAASADEGASVLFTLTTANVAAGSTFAYTLAGITASDVVGGSLTGVATVGSDGKAIVQVNLAADATTDGAKTLTLSIAGKTAAVAVNDTSVTPVVAVPTYTLVAAGDVAEGSVATFVLQTTGLAAGSQVAYKVTGTGTAAGQTATGVFTVDAAGQAAVSVLPPANKVIGDAGTLKVELLNGNATAVTVPVSDATPTTYGLSDLLSQLDMLNPTISFNVTGTAPQTITLETDGFDGGGNFLYAVKSLTAPVTVVTGSGDDFISVQGSMGNTVSSGDGDDVITISGAGSTTINVGAGNDRVTAGAGKETVVVAAGELNADDSFDLGNGTDTVVVSGEGNVIGDNTLQGVENLVLDGTSVTFESLDAFKSVDSISGHADSSDITITMVGDQELDLTAASLTGIRSLSIAGTPATSVTIVADAASLSAIGGISRAVDDNDDPAGPELTLVTDVAGALAAVAIEGEFEAYEIEDTFENVLAAADDLADLEGADITITGEISGDNALTLAGSAVAGASGVTVSMTVAELLTAANYPDQLDALTAEMITIIATGSATVEQAEALLGSYGDALRVAVADTAANVADAAGNVALWAIASSVTLAAGKALSVADAAALNVLKASLADDDIAMTGAYQVSDIAANIAAAVGQDSVKKAASVSIDDDVVTSVLHADALQGLSNLVGGYDVSFLKAETGTPAATRAIAGADTAHVTGTFSIAELGPLRAANADVTVDIITDAAVTLVAFAARLTAATEDIVVTGPNPNVTQAKVIAPQLARINEAGGEASAYTVEDTKTALLSAGSADVVAGAGTVVVRDAMTISQALSLRALNEEGDLTYSVTDTAASFVAQLGAEDTESAEAILDGAEAVTVNSAFTVEEASGIFGMLPAGTIYSVRDNKENLLDAIADPAVVNADTVSVTDAVSLAELDQLQTLGGFDEKYAIKASIGALAAGDRADIVAATGITATGVATTADLPGLSLLNADLEDEDKPEVSYKLAGDYGAIMGALTSGDADIKAAAKASTMITITGTLGAGPDQITAEALEDDLAPAAGNTAYAVKVTGDADEIMAATSLILRNAVVTAIEIDEAVSAGTAFEVIDDIGSTAAAKLSYNLSDIADNLTDADFADVVAGASSLTVIGGALTVEAAAAVAAAAAADAALAYDIQDDYSEIAGNLAIAGGAGTLTVNDETLTVSAYTALLALEVGLEAGPITDTAAAVSGASAAVLAEAAGKVPGIILTDVGALTLTVEQATSLMVEGAYALADAAQQPGGAAATVKVSDTTAAILGLIGTAGGVGPAADVAQAVLNTANTYKIEATDVDSMDVETAGAFTDVATTSAYELTDSAAALLGAPEALVQSANAVDVTGDVSIADAADIFALNDNSSFENVTGIAADLAEKDDDGVPLHAGVLTEAGQITITAATNVAGVAAVKAIAPGVDLTYSLQASALHIGNPANTAIVSAAEQVTVVLPAKAAQAAVIQAYIDQLTGPVNVRDTAANLVAELSATAALAAEGGQVLVFDFTALATGNMTVAQYDTLIGVIDGADLIGNVKDSAAAIANYLLAGDEFDARTVSFSTNKTVNAEQAAALQDFPVTLKVQDTSANLLSTAPEGEGSYTATNTVDLATAKQLYEAFSDALVVSIATTQDRFISAYEYEGGDEAAQAVMQLASSLTVAGKAVVLGSQVDLLDAREDSDLSQAITGTVAELAALPAALLETAGYVVIDSVAHITAAGNQTLVDGSMGYIASDTAANLIAAGTAVLSTASGALGIVVDGAASVASIDTLVNLAPSLASYTTYSLSDTAAALSASDKVADAVEVTATDLADAAEAAAILAANEGASVAVSDTAAALLDAELTGVSAVTVEGTATVDQAEDIVGLADTVTVNIADAIDAVAFADADLLAAAVTVKATGTLTVDIDSADALAQMASLTNLVGGFKVAGDADDLVDADLVSLADLAKATTVTVTDQPVNVAEANVLLTLANLAKVGGTGANATKPALDVADTAVKMASFSAANLAAIGGTATVTNFAASLKAAEATALAALDAGSTKLTIAAPDWAGAKIKDASANLLLAANKAVLAKVGAIEITDAVTVTTFNAVKAADTAAVATTFTYKLVDTVAGVIVAGAGVIDNATSVQVTGSTAFADAQSIVTASEVTGDVATAVKFDLLTGKAADLVSGAGLSTVAAKGTTIDVTDAADVAQATVLAASPKLTGGYTVADDAVTLAGAINTDSGKALLVGATSVALKSGQFANVEQAVLIGGQLTNETALAIKDDAAALSAPAAAAAVAAAASVTVNGSADDDGLARSLTTVKVTYSITELDQLENANEAGMTEIFDADSVYANPSIDASSPASALDVLNLKSGDVISFSSLFAGGGDLAGLTGFTKVTAFTVNGITVPEYRADRGFFTAQGDFVLSAVGTDTLLSFNTDADTDAEKVIVLVGTTTVTGVNATGSTTKVVGLTGG